MFLSLVHKVKSWVSEETNSSLNDWSSLRLKICILSKFLQFFANILNKWDGSISESPSWMLRFLIIGRLCETLSNSLSVLTSDPSLKFLKSLHDLNNSPKPFELRQKLLWISIERNRLILFLIISLITLSVNARPHPTNDNFKSVRYFRYGKISNNSFSVILQQKDKLKTSIDSDFQLILLSCTPSTRVPFTSNNFSLSRFLILDRKLPFTERHPWIFIDTRLGAKCTKRAKISSFKLGLFLISNICNWDNS